ncbi:MAG: hypothetical protein JXR25_01615 [Pontiellaceae bacterium]|nr:hypothetical protein [Pontiellaceae bacterium]MBN2783497.1 hypothetical protein [Pontiellaceae bacterium]
MEILATFAIQIPMFLAILFLVAAAITKAGKERGAVLVIMGAVGLLLLAVISPVIYMTIIPKLIESGNVESVRAVHTTVSVVINIFWAIAVSMIALGTLIRPTAGK